MTSARISDSDIHNVFEVFDSDCTGIIDAQELMHAMKSLGWHRVTEQDIAKMLAGMGKDSRSGEGLNETEFGDLVRSRQTQTDGPEEVMAAFQLFDVDGTGKLTAANLKDAGFRATGQQVSDTLVAEILRLADTDKDGCLSFDEFCQAVVKHEEAMLEADKSTHFAFEGTVSAEQVAREIKREEQAAEAEEQEVKKENDAIAAAATKVEVIAGVKVSFVNDRIAKAEVRRALSELGYDDTMLPANVFTDLFDEQDGNRDGFLSLDEYCQLIVGFGEEVDGY